MSWQLCTSDSSGDQVIRLVFKMTLMKAMAGKTNKKQIEVYVEVYVRWIMSYIAAGRQ